MSAESLTAFILGASGAVGKRLVEVLAKDDNFTKIVLLGRRKIDSLNDFPKVEQQVIDFENLQEHRAAFDGFDVGFCALGTTRGKSGAKLFYRVDHDYIVDSAKIAKEAGTATFCLVSSTGANENSFFLYPKTKGETERDVTALGFERLIIARPGFLEGPREEFRIGEAIGRIFVKPLKWFSNNLAIETIDVAGALTFASLQKSNDSTKIYTNAELINMAKEYQKGNLSAEHQST